MTVNPDRHSVVCGPSSDRNGATPSSPSRSVGRRFAVGAIRHVLLSMEVPPCEGHRSIHSTNDPSLSLTTITRNTRSF